MGVVGRIPPDIQGHSDMKIRLRAFITHPIQYFGPMFRAIAAYPSYLTVADCVLTRPQISNAL